MRYWYISIVKIAVVSNESVEARVAIGFYGGFFLEADVEDELAVVKAAQAKYGRLLPSNCECEVHELTEMPPSFYRDRLLSREELDALDRTEVLQ